MIFHPSMNCLSCHVPFPTGLIDPRFCVTCGKPVAQLCPYEDANHAPLISLRRDDNRSPVDCPNCHQVFKVCSVCGRLYPLSRTGCQTLGCDGDLKEPTSSHPTSTGAEDGSHSLEWEDSFSSEFSPPTILDSEIFFHFAYRYGRLVGITERNLVQFVWQNGNWIRQDTLGLPGRANQYSDLSLCNGYAFVLLDGFAVAVALAGFTIQELFSGTFVKQATKDHLWVRLSDDNHTSSVIVTDCETWDSQTFSLPMEASSVAAVVIDEQIFVATSTTIIRLNVETGQVGNLVFENAEWLQIAAAQGKIVALGRSNSGIILTAISEEGRLLGKQSVSNDYLAEFCWIDDDIYLADVSESKLYTYNLNQLSQLPTSKSLSRGQQINEGLLGLRGQNRINRVLIRLSGGSVGLSASTISRLMLIDPTSGSQLQLGGALSGVPIVCVADGRIVVGSREAGGMKLRTYQFGEHR